MGSSSLSRESSMRWHSSVRWWHSSHWWRHTSSSHSSRRITSSPSENRLKLLVHHWHLDSSWWLLSLHVHDQWKSHDGLLKFLSLEIAVTLCCFFFWDKPTDWKFGAIWEWIFQAWLKYCIVGISILFVSYDCFSFRVIPIKLSDFSILLKCFSDFWWKASSYSPHNNFSWCVTLRLHLNWLRLEKLAWFMRSSRSFVFVDFNSKNFTFELLVSETDNGVFSLMWVFKWNNRVWLGTRNLATFYNTIGFKGFLYFILSCSFRKSFDEKTTEVFSDRLHESLPIDLNMKRNLIPFKDLCLVILVLCLLCIFLCQQLYIPMISYFLFIAQI